MRLDALMRKDRALPIAGQVQGADHATLQHLLTGVLLVHVQGGPRVPNQDTMTQPAVQVCGGASLVPSMQEPGDVVWPGAQSAHSVRADVVVRGTHHAGDVADTERVVAHRAKGVQA